MLTTGTLVALATVLCWTGSVQFFEAASKKVGAIPVNIIRLSVALLLFSIFLFWRDGVVIPTHFPAHAWLFLSLSGMIGFFFGDIFLFKALVELGPRITMLIQSLAAPTAALIGWLVLGEQYLLHQWLGMLVTLSGVTLVVLERGKKKTARSLQPRDATMKGVCFALLAMIGQAGGLLLSKAGMQVENGYLDAFSATQIRALAAFFCFLIYFTLGRRWSQVGAAVHNTWAVLLTATGAFLGPFLGVSLSLLALHYLTAGVACTYFALVPVCIIPFAVYLHKEHVSLRAICGACIAVFGVYLLTGF